MNILRFSNAIIFGLILLAGSVRAELVVIVHPDNSASKLSKLEVGQIFLGRIRMYPNTQVAANAVDQDPKTQDYRLFYKKLVNLSVLKIRKYRAAYIFSGRGSLPEQMSDGDAVKRFVAQNVNAIGYIDRSLLDSSVKAVFAFSQ